MSHSAGCLRVASITVLVLAASWAARATPLAAQAPRRPVALSLSDVPTVSPTARASTWRGGILLDEDARDALRLDGDEARELSATVSDVLLAATMLGTTVESLAVPLAQGDPRLAWQASAAHVLALGLTLFLGDVVKGAVGRARPFERACRADPSAPGCQSPDTFASFYSLHTAMASASAGFSCAMHLSRSLYGDPVADAASCGVSIALAAVTGLLRITADRHYLSDVVVGALLGFVVGFVVPLALVPTRATASESAIAADERLGEAPPLGSLVVSFSGAF